MNIQGTFSYLLWSAKNSARDPRFCLGIVKVWWYVACSGWCLRLVLTSRLFYDAYTDWPTLWSFWPKLRKKHNVFYVVSKFSGGEGFFYLFMSDFRWTLVDYWQHYACFILLFQPTHTVNRSVNNLLQKNFFRICRYTPSIFCSYNSGKT